MKNKILLILILLFLKNNTFAENLLIQAKDITLDKNKELSIFKNEVSIITEEKNTIKSNYAEFDRKKNIIKLKGNVIAKDNLNNTVSSEYAEYDDNTKIFRSLGPTEIITSENYKINGKILFLIVKKILSNLMKIRLLLT